MDFEELHAKGWAEVIQERPCPKIASGPGRVVTATITHANDDVRTLTMSSGEELYVTGNHRMYSATQRDWVPVKDLEIGEALRTNSGRESVAALGFQRGRHQVYNIEVETEHCYFVGSGEVLTHNSCVTDSAKPSHGNSDASTKPQHGYEIYDKETGDVAKTGISGQPLNKNGTSPRANGQVNELNRGAGYEKYSASDPYKNIGKNRGEAKQWEQGNTDRLFANKHSLERHKLPKPTPKKTATKRRRSR